MITNLRPYTATRDSGIPWIGAVPKHWEIRRLGALLRERGETNSDGQEDRVLSVLRGRGVIPYTEKGNVGNKKSEDITRYKIVRPNDIVVNSMNVIIGSVGLSRYSGCLSPVYYVLTRRSVHDNPRYLDALFQVTPFQKSLVRIGNGILAHRMRIPMELLKCENFPYPPHDEQTAIVRFLVHIDQKLQRLIRAKRKLLVLLREQRESVIHHTVTRGLDPNVRLKSSGNQWLGDVPAYWAVRRLRNTCLMKVSNVDKHKRDDELRVRLCNYVDVYNNDRIHSDLNFMYATATRSEVERFRLRCGDVLITKDSETWNDIGVPALVEDSYDDLLSGYHLALLRPFPRHLNSTYLFHALQSSRVSHQFHVAANGVTRFGLSQNAIKSIWIPVPPITDQVAIVSFLNRVNSDIDRATKSAQQEISLLAEYRTRLIADVVTGKLDVREAVVYTQESFDESGSPIAGDVRVHVTEDESADVLETET